MRKLGYPRHHVRGLVQLMNEIAPCILAAGQQHVSPSALHRYHPDYEEMTLHWRALVLQII